MINIVVSDDHHPFRNGLIESLNADANLAVIGAGSSAHEAVALVNELRPQMVILDLQMPGGGIPAARQIAQTHPQTKIVILTNCDDDQSIEAAYEIGVRGYLLKGISSRALIHALHDIYNCQADSTYWPSFSKTQGAEQQAI